MEKLNNNQVQVILTGTFGDGGVRTTLSTGVYRTNCKMKDYLEFKSELLGDISKGIRYIDKNGYSQTYIWELNSLVHKDIREIHNSSLIEKLGLLDNLGIAMWMYDDGSIHKKNLFYNINTHAFSEEDNIIISKFLNKKLGIYSRVMTERKKDGRVFYYIFVPPCGGAYKLSLIMEKFNITSYSYKLYPKRQLSEMKSIHEYADKIYNAGTQEHFEYVTSLRLRLSGYRKKNKELTVNEFLLDYVNRPKWVKRVKE